MEISPLHEINDEVLQAFAHLTPQLSPGSPIPTQPHLQAVLGQPGTTLLAARLDGRICGLLTLVLFKTPMGTHAWIEDVVVDEAARGRGIGEALTREALRLAEEQGAAHVDLTSRPAREAANRLYQRVGFQRWETNLYRLLLKKKD